MRRTPLDLGGRKPLGLQCSMNQVKSLLAASEDQDPPVVGMFSADARQDLRKLHELAAVAGEVDGLGDLGLERPRKASVPGHIPDLAQQRTWAAHQSLGQARPGKSVEAWECLSEQFLEPPLRGGCMARHGQHASLGESETCLTPGGAHHVVLQPPSELLTTALAEPSGGCPGVCQGVLGEIGSIS